MPTVISCELSWSCNSEMNSSMGVMLVNDEVNISSSLDGNISNCDLVRRVDDCKLCNTIDYWLEGPIIFAVCLAGILGWWLWESASFMFMGLLWSHWCLQQPSEQKTRSLDFFIYHLGVSYKQKEKKLGAKMYYNIYYSDDKGKGSTSLSTLCPDQRKSRSTNAKSQNPRFHSIHPKSIDIKGWSEVANLYLLPLHFLNWFHTNGEPVSNKFSFRCDFPWPKIFHFYLEKQTIIPFYIPVFIFFLLVLWDINNSP